MSEQDLPRELLAPALCDRCRAETRRFREGERHDDSYCLEVVRRAVELRDDHCWSALTAIYHELVTSWCWRAGAGEAEIDELVSSTWVKFWQSYTVEKLAAGGSMAATLAYLKMCARSAVMDQRRRHARFSAHEEPVADDLHGAGLGLEANLARLDRDSFWALVAQHLRDEREQMLLYLTYEIGMRPAEIYQLHADQFADVREVYRLTRNVLDRLRRSRPLADWLSADDA